VDNHRHSVDSRKNLSCFPRTLAPRGTQGVEILPRRKRTPPQGKPGDAEGAGKPEPEAGGWPRRSARRSRCCQANRPAWIGRSSKAPSISYMEGALSYCARLSHPCPPTTRQQIVTKRGHAAEVDPLEGQTQCPLCQGAGHGSSALVWWQVPEWLGRRAGRLVGQSLPRVWVSRARGASASARPGQGPAAGV
jgi:hypothetical protein